MTNRRVFQRNISDYDYYVSQVKEMMLEGSCFCDQEDLANGLQDLNNIDDVTRQLKMIRASLQIDKEFPGIGIGKCAKNILRKLPLILTIADMMNNHYPLICDLSSDELVLLSAFVFCIKRDKRRDKLPFLANEKLLSTIIEKTAARDDQVAILSVIEEKSFEFGVVPGDQHSCNQFIDEAVSFIQKTECKTFVERFLDSVEEEMRKGKLY